MTAPTSSPASPGMSMDAMMADIAGDSIKQTLSEQADPQSTRDDRGRFASNAEDDTDANDSLSDVSADENTTDNADEADTTPLPKGMVAVPTITREMATAFTVADAEGAIEPPDLTIEFTANGKSRREPLDKVVKLAQWGVYNHEKHQQAEAAMQQAEALQGQIQQYDATVRQMQFERQQLLTNDDAYLNARAAFEQQNTPEARLQMERQQLQSQRAQMEFSQAQQVGTQFLDTRVEPALELIASALPTVSKEELAARVLLVANRYTVQTPFGAIINPQAHTQIAEAIRDDIVPWAQQVHDQRNNERSALTAGQSKKTQALQVEAQKAKNMAARAMKAVGHSGPQSKNRPPIKTMDDAIADSIRSSLESIGLR
jgi:hypothetical protein